MADGGAEGTDATVDGLALDALIETHLATAHAQLATIGANPQATLRPLAEASTQYERTMSRLAELAGDAAAVTGGVPVARLELHEQLGQGGMGVVHLATQKSLGRRVAVKSTRVDRRDPASVAQVLREAWITGSLEHPNVVPIYDVQIDAGGRPLIVMRRVDGRHWGALMHDADAIRAEEAAPDPLEWNLRILRSVCNALELAHNRGVVHRDVKPENVMLGRFGEVYLLDWGLAVSRELDPETGPRVDGLVGTPAYMAPEMLGGGPEIDARTDVYLLGATLYELISGQPPHRASSVRDLFRSVLESAPTFSDEAPPVLVRICRRAMARDPAQRYADVASFRAALDEFLRFRVSDQIAARATGRLLELEAELEAGGTRGALYELFGECRFGFREALTQWPDNTPAREALARATRLMIARELEDGDARAASLLLAELEDPPTSLVAAVAQACRAADVERKRHAALERLGRDLDPTVGQRTRWKFAFTLGAIWTLMPIGIGWRVHIKGEVMAPWEIVVGPFAMAAGVLLVAALGRRSLRLSAINRRMVGLLVATMAAMELSHVGLLGFGLPVPTIQVADVVLWVGMGAALTAFVDTRLWPTAVFFAITFLLCTRWPDWHFFILAAGNFACSLTFFWVWRPGAAREPDPG